MSEETEGRTISREEIDAKLSDTLVENLRQLISAKRDASLFRDRLVHVLYRYERIKSGACNTPRKERRAEIAKLYRTTEKFVKVLNQLPQDAIRSLSSGMAVLADSEGFEAVSLEQRLPEPGEDTSLQDAEAAARNILAACQMELDYFNITKGAKKGSAKPALDQLIIDLAALYETETGNDANSHSYRDVTVEDEFNGKFYQMTKALLDCSAPEDFGTPIALGRRIAGVLAEE